MKHLFNYTLLVLPILLGQSCLHAQTSARAASGTPGKAELKVYLAQDESARRVMESLVSMFGYRVLSDSLPTRPVSGRFEVRSIEDVMSYFKGAYELNYFVNGINVHVYKSSDWRTKRIYVGGSDRSNDDWRELLTSSGLYYTDFPFVINRDKKELVVSGPKAYIQLVETTFGEKLPDPSEAEKHGIKLMVFPLKYASVDDRTTDVRNTKVVTPGALSVLLNLLGLPSQRIQNAPDRRQAGMLNDSALMFGASDLSAGDAMARLPISDTADLGKNGEKKSRDDPMPVSVTADPRTNSILIRDAASRYDYYKDLIDQLDRPVAMIEVEAIMVEVDQQTMSELGLEFGLNAGNMTYNFPGQSVGRENFFTPGTSSIVDPGRFLARLRALDADENIKVLARPTIVTQDNVTAYIDLSQTLFLQLTGERVAQVKEVTAGSLLQVTPRVVKDDFSERIFIRVDIQDGTIADPSGIGMPRVQNTSISTQALIDRERAVLIGGYNRNAKDDLEYRVPLLGSLPLVGAAFRTTETRNQELSRLFLIVPRLIEAPAQNHRSTRAAANFIDQNFSFNSEALKGEKSMRLDRTLSNPPEQ